MHKLLVAVIAVLAYVALLVDVAFVTHHGYTWQAFLGLAALMVGTSAIPTK